MLGLLSVLWFLTALVFVALLATFIFRAVKHKTKKPIGLALIGDAAVSIVLMVVIGVNAPLPAELIVAEINEPPIASSAIAETSNAATETPDVTVPSSVAPTATPEPTPSVTPPVESSLSTSPTPTIEPISNLSDEDLELLKYVKDWYDGLRSEYAKCLGSEVVSGIKTATYWAQIMRNSNDTLALYESSTDSFEIKLAIGDLKILALEYTSKLSGRGDDDFILWAETTMDTHFKILREVAP
ncbi:MAG: hypothetical protein LBT44_01330 [Clostridiales bacterium]|jgi:hypothetical protein|nr:hypothetical protein [Clostridiales bacterium]